MGQQTVPGRAGETAYISRSDHELMAEVHYDRMDRVLKRIKIAAVAALFFSVVMAVYLHETSGIPVWHWLTVKTLLVIWRLAMVFRWEHIRNRQPVLGRWFFWLRINLFIDGTILGAITYLAISTDTPEQSLLWTGTVLCTLAAASMSTLESDWISALLYASPMIGQIIISLAILHPNPFHYTILGLIIFWVVMLLNARRASRDEEQRLLQGHAIRRYQKQNEVALEMARTESRLRIEMMSSITHELRTPIHGILAMSHQIAKDPQAASTAKAAEMIIKSGEHLVGLINDALDFGRLEAAGVTLRPEVFDLNELIAEVSHIGFMIGQEKGVKFDVWNILPTPYHVHADPGRLKQIALNLISNGLKFTEKGGEVVLRVRDADGHGSVVMDVSDTGPGIAPENLTTIFEPFSRHAGGRTQKGLGSTGLGLSISKRLAAAMKGNLEVSSLVGKGSTFTLKVKLAKVVVSLQNKNSKQDQATPVSLKGYALIAEDDNLTAELARTALEMYGMTVSVVGRGDMAVLAATMDKHRPDILLMDGDMPGMDGLTATRRIREHESQTGISRVPIVIISGRCTREDVDDARRAGADDHLAKPYSNGDLLRIVAANLPVETAPKRSKLN